MRFSTCSTACYQAPIPGGRQECIPCDFTGPGGDEWLLGPAAYCSALLSRGSRDHCAGRALSSVLMPYSHMSSLPQRVLYWSTICQEAHSPLCAASRECCEKPWPAGLAEGDKYRSPTATVYHTQVSEVHRDHRAAGSASHLCVPLTSEWVQAISSQCFQSSQLHLVASRCRGQPGTSLVQNASFCSEILARMDAFWSTELLDVL